MLFENSGLLMWHDNKTAIVESYMYSKSAANPLAVDTLDIARINNNFCRRNVRLYCDRSNHGEAFLNGSSAILR